MFKTHIVAPPDKGYEHEAIATRSDFNASNPFQAPCIRLGLVSHHLM